MLRITEEDHSIVREDLPNELDLIFPIHADLPSAKWMPRQGPERNLRMLESEEDGYED
jgi:hypothetical protein